MARPPVNKSPFLRLGVLFASIPIAFAAGALTHSQNVFVVVFGVGVVVSFVLRYLWR